MPGPQKALIATNRSDVAKRVRDAQEFLVSSHHFAAALSLGLALLEFRSFGSDYAAAVIANAQTLGAELHARGLPVAAEHRGFSGGHQLWLDIEQLGISARDASERLFATGIRVNFLPDMPGFGPREAIRLGLNEATYHGLRPGEMATLGAAMSAAIRAEESPEVLRATVEALRETASQHGEPIPRPSQDLLDKAMRLCATALTSCYQDVNGAQELANPTAHQLTGGGA
jgi:glycine/serine hydroxymethyltransferase